MLMRDDLPDKAALPGFCVWLPGRFCNLNPGVLKADARCCQDRHVRIYSRSTDPQVREALAAGTKT